MSIFEQTRSFLTQVGQNVESASAYDTAWLAALPAPDSTLVDRAPRYPRSLEWLLQHQQPDGSWGGPWPYYHDRLISTLRAVLTMHGWGRRAEDKQRIDQGLTYIWRNADRLVCDPTESIGFELIFPALLAQAEQQGLQLPYSAFGRVMHMREHKLSKGPLELAYSRYTPLAISLEALGPGFDPARTGELQEETGAVGLSPSATAYLLQQQPDNHAALAYVERVLQVVGGGGAPAFYPTETFERGWALYHLQYALPDLHLRLGEAVASVLQDLRATQRPGGWATSIHITVQEADTTGICFTALGQAGDQLDPHLLYQYEEADHFRCYHFERNPSISTNTHVLSALHYCPVPERTPRVEKVLGFLKTQCSPLGCWFDKWHTSPYYATGHVILAAHDFAPDLVEPAVTWLLYTQDAEGGWGYYAPTVEETAYALLALIVWQRAGHPVSDCVLARGAAYLRRHFTPEHPDYPPLWIGKSLYTPVQVVQGAVLAALLAWETHS